ncbi:MAG: phosphoenolpyruvate synthase [Bacteroidales bacterium]|nr:phosphoenolpyruvate synthase [Bacteroidales bacterium]
MEFIKNFTELRSKHTSEVGGKNASLGEMISRLGPKGIRIPDGFATTADAYWYFLKENDLKNELKKLMGELDTDDFKNLKDIGGKARKMIMDAEMPEKFTEAIKKAYKELQEREKDMESVAVRSSATAEDLPSASFAGQHETYLNVKGEEEVVQAVKKCIASLFTDRAIKYRVDNGFDHMKVALSAGVQRMVRADKASAGVMFTIAPESGFDKVVFITGNYGLGENVVQGNVKADQFYVFKPSLKKSRRAILSKKMGSKSKTMVYSEAENSTTKNTRTPKKKRDQFVISDEEIEQLARWGILIEELYEKAMDIEWAKDGNSGELFIVQARPETVHSSKKEKSKLKNYTLKEESKKLVDGTAIGDKIASGKVKILDSPEESDKLKEGDVLVTEITNPDWDPVMEKASAIITNSGGRTSHAAIVARELGAVAIVGAEDATEKLKDGQEVTVSCAGGTDGFVYEGLLEWKEEEIDFKKMKTPKTEVMLILGDLGLAFQYARYPVKGVGLMRLEFVINNAIRAHPMALINYKKLKNKSAKKEIKKLTHLYEDKTEYFTDRLSQAVGTIAAAFYPDDVIVRMSDFKSNEYAGLLGGEEFEPEEENPMLGFRGASRYHHEKYRKGFKLECEAMRIVRDEMGLTNVKLMIPFCRTTEEAENVLEVMERYGLKQGWHELEIYMMVEIPSNVMLIDQFAKLFDGFSIGSNDLTQLTLGLDRDSAEVSDLFDEKNPAPKKMISMAIKGANKSNTKIGLCGQAPSDFPEIAQFLVNEGIDSISFNPDAVAQGIENILKAEKKK